MEWKRLESGNYISLDNRFAVKKAGDRKWVLYDMSIETGNTAIGEYGSLRHTKCAAEMRAEKREIVL